MIKPEDESVPLYPDIFSFDIFEGELRVFSDRSSAMIDTIEKAKAIQAMIQKWIDVQEGAA